MTHHRDFPSIVVRDPFKKERSDSVDDKQITIYIGRAPRLPYRRRQTSTAAFADTSPTTFYITIRTARNASTIPYLRAWRSIPPQRPSMLKAFLGAITRNLALDKYDQLKTEKRGLGQTPAALDELRECLPAQDDTERVADHTVLVDVLNRFLASLPAQQRKIFMRRYWYFNTIREIAAAYGVGESKVKMSLLRSRNELRQLLEKEGISI